MQTIEKIIAALGRFASLLNLLLILVIIVDVALRFLFSQTAAWVLELEWHLFAMIFLLGIPYALQRDRHVRVDLFYERFAPADRALVDFLGSILFLLPWAVVLLVTSWSYAAEALRSGEGSPNPNGIPYFFPIKFVIPLAAFLLLLQGGVVALRSYRTWRKPVAE